MAKKFRLNVHVADAHINKILRTFELTNLLEEYLKDDRVEELYKRLRAIYQTEYPDTLATVNQHVPNNFYKDYAEFSKTFHPNLKRTFAEFALEEFAATGNIPSAIKRIHSKAPQLFEQRLGLVFEEIRYNMRADKLLNGQQPVDWLQ